MFEWKGEIWGCFGVCRLVKILDVYCVGDDFDTAVAELGVWPSFILGDC